MQSVKYVYWQEGAFWLGYLQDYPDYWTQGESLDDLKEHSRTFSRISGPNAPDQSGNGGVPVNLIE